MKKTEETRTIYRYSESLKRKIVTEIELGELSVREAMRHYDILHRKTISRWQTKYGKNKIKTKVVRVMMTDEKKRIEQLEKALVDERLLSGMYKHELKYYEEQVPDIKKKLSTKELKDLEELQKKRRKLA